MRGLGNSLYALRVVVAVEFEDYGVLCVLQFRIQCTFSSIRSPFLLMCVKGMPVNTLNRGSSSALCCCVKSSFCRG
jgi:hypothetical protein